MSKFLRLHNDFLNIASIKEIYIDYNCCVIDIRDFNDKLIWCLTLEYDDENKINDQEKKEFNELAEKITNSISFIELGEYTLFHTNPEIRK